MSKIRVHTRHYLLPYDRRLVRAYAPPGVIFTGHADLVLEVHDDGTGELLWVGAFIGRYSSLYREGLLWEKVGLLLAGLSNEVYIVQLPNGELVRRLDLRGYFQDLYLTPEDDQVAIVGESEVYLLDQAGNTVWHRDGLPVNGAQLVAITSNMLKWRPAVPRRARIKGSGCPVQLGISSSEQKEGSKG